MPDRLEELKATLSWRYRIDREIGRGGMASVYLADDTKHDRKVAIKVLRPDISAVLGSDRFLHEIKVTAQLQHPHILPLHDSGYAAGVLYYVMPFVDGPTLRQRLAREGRLAVEDALKIARDIGEGLAHAHALGVIHRDIKPENILFSGDHAIIADFGIAHALAVAGRDAPSDSGLAVGTPEYMSPEQAVGEPPTAQCDVHSLGCLLYEMLVGEPPFAAADMATIIARKATAGEPLQVRSLRADVSPALEQAIQRALAPPAAERFAGVAEFTAALRLDRVAAPPPPALSIAVLPFVDLGSEGGADYLGDGLAEEITGALAKIRSLRVAARTSAFAFKNKNLDIRGIGTQLDVASVLEGTVQRSDDRLRVTAQLIDVASGFHRWSGRFDRRLEDVFRIQDEIARSIVRALEVVLADRGSPAVQAPTANMKAYEYYLKGKQYFAQTRRKSLEYATEMFAHAADLDPGFTLAHVGLANACAVLHMFYPGSPETLSRADAASARAVDLDPELAEARSARGLALFQMKRLAEAEPEFRKAIDLDPQSFEARYFFGRARFQRGEFAEAARLFEEACQVREDYAARYFVAQALEAAGEDSQAAYRRARRAAEEHLDLNPDDARAATMCSAALCRTGETAAGLAWAERALAIDPNDAGVAYNVACAFAIEGRTERAIECLGKALENGFGNIEWIGNDPDLLSLRQHSEFQKLLARFA